MLMTVLTPLLIKTQFFVSPKLICSGELNSSFELESSSSLIGNLNSLSCSGEMFLHHPELILIVIHSFSTQSQFAILFH